MNDIITKILGSSPWTSILGYLLAIVTIAKPIIEKDGFDFKRDWLTLVGAIAVALIGRQAKDTNGVKAVEGLAMKQALIAPTPEPEIIEPEPTVKLNEDVAAVAKANIVQPTKKKIVRQPKSPL